MKKENSDKLAEEWALKNNSKIIGFLGSGGYGYAYEIPDNKVIKITRHFGEAAFSYDAIRLQPNGYVNTHSVEMVNKELFIIVMDKLEISETTQEISKELFTILDNEGFDFFTDIEDIEHLLSSEEHEMFTSLQDIIEENKQSFHMLDLHDENIGEDMDGYVIFDQFHVRVPKVEYSMRFDKYKTAILEEELE